MRLLLLAHSDSSCNVLTFALRLDVPNVEATVRAKNAQICIVGHAHVMYIADVCKAVVNVARSAISQQAGSLPLTGASIRLSG